MTGDEVYGQDPAMRRDLIGRGVGYVLAVSRDHRVITGIGARRAVEIAGRLPEARVATAIRRHRPWSRWRRRHHARAMACHYRRRQLT